MPWTKPAATSSNYYLNLQWAGAFIECSESVKNIKIEAEIA